jgi:hypothetical protein
MKKEAESASHQQLYIRADPSLPSLSHRGTNFAGQHMQRNFFDGVPLLSWAYLREMSIERVSHQFIRIETWAVPIQSGMPCDLLSHLTHEPEFSVDTDR